MEQARGDMEPVQCPACGRSVPALRNCIECGSSLHSTTAPARPSYAANPREPARAVRLFSTLFPHLPHQEIEGFRIAFVVGAAVVAVLIAVGAFPLALVSAVLVIPLLFILYFFAVDIYEGEPLKVVAATLVWGAIVGLVTGLVARWLSASDTIAGGTVPLDLAVRDGVVLPIAGVALLAAGPLFLLRYPAFDDVLDGATFGAIAASMYVAMNVFVRTFDVLRDGLTPGGETAPWLIQVATIGLAYPVLVASVVGSVCAAFWLRFRAPVGDRTALGWLGRPVVACLAGGALLAIAGLGRAYLTQLGGLIAVAVPAVVALIWLRLTIHLGLREESAGSGDGPEVRCAECGALTPRARFCGTCGVALRAQPLTAGSRRAAQAGSTPPTAEPT